MTHHKIEPVDPREAFEVVPRTDSKSDFEIAASQAAFLLALRAGVLGADQEVMELQAAGKRKKPAFPLPRLEPLKRTKRMNIAEAMKCLGASRRELKQEKDPNLKDDASRLVREIYEKPTIESTASLFEAAMYSPHPLVAVAAAASARETTRLRQDIRTTLEDASESEDPLIARMAQVALVNIDPGDSVLECLTVPRPKSRKRNRKSNTAVVTHGTFAADSDWYQPGGEFYLALDARRPDLHVHDQSFRWTGAYSHDARRADAVLLQQWIGHQGVGVPDFFAHSHGGTVAHLATRLGVQFNRLVLLSWPRHKKWYPDFGKVNRIIDIRVKLDLVIMIDLGGQSFGQSGPNIETHRHGWFNHSATHEPEYWDDHGLWAKI